MQSSPVYLDCTRVPTASHGFFHGQNDFCFGSTLPSTSQSERVDPKGGNSASSCWATPISNGSVDHDVLCGLLYATRAKHLQIEKQSPDVNEGKPPATLAVCQNGIGQGAVN